MGSAGDGEDEEIRYLTDAQARGLFRAAEEAGSRWRGYYVAAVRTGLREALRREGLGAGQKDLVFPSTSGGPMNSGNLRRRELQPLLRQTGLPEITLHELRHTFASIMLHEWLVPPAVVSKMMGHASISFTFDVYGHLIPSADEDVIRRLNALQRPAGEGREAG